MAVVNISRKMMLNIPTSIRDPTYRYRMPAVATKIEGRGNGIKTRVLNLKEVARALRVNPQYPLKYWGYDLGAPTEFKAGEDKYMLNGSFPTSALQESLDKFIEKFVLCGRCKYPEIIVQVKKNKIWSDCAACGANLIMDNTHKLAAFILKNPPPVEVRLKNNENRKVKATAEAEEVKEGEPVPEVTISSEEVHEAIARLQEATVSAEELAELVKSICVSHAFSAEIRLYVILAGVFGQNICPLLRSNKDLTRLLRKESRHKAPELLTAFAAYYLASTDFHKYISTCCKLLLDGKVIAEEDFLAWKKGELEFNETSAVYNPELLASLRACATQFLDWLEAAEEEEGSDEEEDEETKESEEVIRQKQLIKEHLAAQSAGAPAEQRDLQVPPEPGARKPPEPPEARIDLISIVNQQDDDLDIDDI